MSIVSPTSNTPPALSPQPSPKNAEKTPASCPRSVNPIDSIEILKPQTSPPAEPSQKNFFERCWETFINFWIEVCAFFAHLCCPKKNVNNLDQKDIDYGQMLNNIKRIQELRNDAGKTLSVEDYNLAINSLPAVYANRLKQATNVSDFENQCRELRNTIEIKAFLSRPEVQENLRKIIDPHVSENDKIQAFAALSKMEDREAFLSELGTRIESRLSEEELEKCQSNRTLEDANFIRNNLDRPEILRAFNSFVEEINFALKSKVLKSLAAEILNDRVLSKAEFVSMVEPLPKEYRNKCIEDFSHVGNREKDQQEFLYTLQRQFAESVIVFLEDPLTSQESAKSVINSAMNFEYINFNNVMWRFTLESVGTCFAEESPEVGAKLKNSEGAIDLQKVVQCMQDNPKDQAVINYLKIYQARREVFEQAELSGDDNELSEDDNELSEDDNELSEDELLELEEQRRKNAETQKKVDDAQRKLKALQEKKEALISSLQSRAQAGTGPEGSS